MIRLNLPVAIITIIARRLIDHCRPTHLMPFLFRQNSQLAIGYSRAQPSLLLGVTLGIIYIYRRYLSRKKVERRASYNSNYSPKRLGTQPDMRVCSRRPWYVKKCDPISNINKYVSNPPTVRSRSRRRFTLPSLSKKEFIKPLVEESDSVSVTSNRKPTIRTSHQSTMITDSLLTFNESKQFPDSSNYLTEISRIDNKKDEEPHRLQPVVNLSQNCIDLISNDGDRRMKLMPNASNNSIDSSMLGATPKILMSENVLNDNQSKYTDKKLTQLSREILYSNASPDDDDDDDMSKLSAVSPITSDMSIETYAKKPKRKRRGKLRFSIKKNHKNALRKNSSTSFSLNRTRSGRIYNTGSVETTTTCKRQPKKR